MTSNLNIISNEIILKIELQLPLNSILRQAEKIINGAKSIELLKVDFLPEQMYFGAWVAYLENEGDQFNKNLKFSISAEFTPDEINEINKFLVKLI